MSFRGRVTLLALIATVLFALPTHVLPAAGTTAYGYDVPAEIADAAPTAADVRTTPAATLRSVALPGRPSPRASSGSVRLVSGFFRAAKAAEVLPKPVVDNPKLGNIVNDLYKGTTNPNRVGNGTTADAIRNEIATGQRTAGRFHSQKGLEYERALVNFLRRNPNGSYRDRLTAQSLLDDLRSARGGP